MKPEQLGPPCSEQTNTKSAYPAPSLYISKGVHLKLFSFFESFTYVYNAYNTFGKSSLRPLISPSCPYQDPYPLHQVPVPLLCLYGFCFFFVF